MSESGHDSAAGSQGGAGTEAIEQVRLQRAKRHEVATRLIDLAGSLDSDIALSTMESLKPDSLDTLPLWCLMDDASLHQFQRLLGALFLAPALRKCIDGSRLVQWQGVMGAALFESVMAARLPAQMNTVTEFPDIPPEADEALLLANGASLLLSTLTDEAIRYLMMQRFNAHHGLVSQKLALEVHRVALDTLQHITDAAGIESSDDTNSLLDDRAIS